MGERIFFDVDRLGVHRGELVARAELRRVLWRCGVIKALGMRWVSLRRYSIG